MKNEKRCFECLKQRHLIYLSVKVILNVLNVTKTIILPFVRLILTKVIKTMTIKTRSTKPIITMLEVF